LGFNSTHSKKAYKPFDENKSNFLKTPQDQEENGANYFERTFWLNFLTKPHFVFWFIVVHFIETNF
jgi:hypothetical protein